MTTNSPNPVDGDVQELISNAEAIIELFESAGAINQIAYKLAKIAHASLTAVPTFSTSVPQKDIVDDGFIGSLFGPDVFAIKLYTAPPAQLLRPVELPEFKVHSNQPCWPSITVGLRDGEWIEALRQQGYEVKS